MKSFQDRLLKDFDVRQELQKNGRVKKVYVYKGEYASWDASKEELRRYKRLHRNAAILLCAFYVWAALQRIPMNASKVSGFFTLLSLAALVAVIMGVVPFVRSKEKMYVRDLREMKAVILWSTMIYFILQAGNVLAGIVHGVTQGGSLVSALVILAYGISGALALVIFLAQNKLKYKILEKNKTWKQKGQI